MHGSNKKVDKKERMKNMYCNNIGGRNRVTRLRDTKANVTTKISIVKKESQ